MDMQYGGETNLLDHLLAEILKEKDTFLRTFITLSIKPFLWSFPCFNIVTPHKDLLWTNIYSFIQFVAGKNQTGEC